MAGQDHNPEGFRQLAGYRISVQGPRPVRTENKSPLGVFPSQRRRGKWSQWAFAEEKAEMQPVMGLKLDQQTVGFKSGFLTQGKVMKPISCVVPEKFRINRKHQRAVSM